MKKGVGMRYEKLRTIAAKKILFLSGLVTREGPWTEFRWWDAC